MIEEAQLEQHGSGLEPAGDGWFVVNVLDAAWIVNETFGSACVFESDAAQFPQNGFTLGVLQPGQPSGMYHRESNQEDFLVLAGECVLLVEGEERPLKAGDFFHSPRDCEHIFVGGGDGPCVIFMTGSRTDKTGIVYPRSQLALRHGAGVETETTKPAEAYAPFPEWVPSDRPGTLPWT
jgi:uncharacterized cupin superfamily protein